MIVKEALEAIDARLSGEWDNPSLVAFGPLMPDEADDIEAIKKRCLEDYGFIVGPRDPRLNMRFPGKFMVVESHEESELPTEDGRNGPFCVVGDYLGPLIDQGFMFLVSCED